MLWRHARYFIAATAVTVTACLFVSTPSFALFEKYTWTDYKTISGASGIYGMMSGGNGDVVRPDFNQDVSNPVIYTLDGGGNSCPDGLTLTLTSDTAGALTSGQACNLYTGADKNIKISGRDVGIKSVESEEQRIIGLQDTTRCDSLGAQKQPCLDEYKKKAADAQGTCLGQHNFRQNVTAGAAYLDCIAKTLNVDPNAKASDTSNDKPSRCTIPESGWLICANVTFLANLTDYTFKLLKPLLVITPLSDSPASGNNETMYSAWKAFRSIANVLLVVAFMVIIYSQLTGWGIGAYGIKKMTPRLVVAAILINVSFLISALAIDVSNVIGAGIQDMMTSMAAEPVSESKKYSSWSGLGNAVTSTDATTDPDDQNNLNSSTTQNPPTAGSSPQQPSTQQPPADPNIDPEVDLVPTKLVVGGATITGIAVMFLELSALVPIMVASLFAMITALLVLLARQAIIIVLVVIAPIAFACYLLPNTNKWFERWRKTFTDMLLIFPLISIVYGGSYLASQVVRKTAEANGEVLLGIFSLGILVIPLFVTPVLVKVGGGVLSQFAGVINNKNKGLYDRSMNRANEFRDDRKAIRQMNNARGKTLFGKISVPEKINRFRGPNRRAHRAEKRKQAEAAAKARQTEYTTDNHDVILDKALKHVNQPTTDAIKEVLGGIQLSDQERLELDHVNAAEVRFRNAMNANQLNEDQVMEMSEKGTLNGRKLTEAERRAALRLAAEQFNDAADSTGEDGVAKANRLVARANNGPKGMSINERRELINAIRSSGVSKKAAYLGGSSLGKIEQGMVEGQAGVEDLVVSAAKGGKFSQQALAESAGTTLDLIHKNIDHPKLVENGAARQLQKDASAALTNSNLSTGIKDANKRRLENIGSSRGGGPL